MLTALPGKQWTSKKARADDLRAAGVARLFRGRRRFGSGGTPPLVVIVVTVVIVVITTRVTTAMPGRAPAPAPSKSAASTSAWRANKLKEDPDYFKKQEKARRDATRLQNEQAAAAAAPAAVAPAPPPAATAVAPKPWRPVWPPTALDEAAHYSSWSKLMLSERGERSVTCCLPRHIGRPTRTKQNTGAKSRPTRSGTSCTASSSMTAWWTRV